jgi:hypothetical protein
MATAAQLRALRQKYGLGEFKKGAPRGSATRAGARPPARRAPARKPKRKYKQRAKSFKTGFMTGNWGGVWNPSAAFLLHEAAYAMSTRTNSPGELPPSTEGLVPPAEGRDDVSP